MPDGFSFAEALQPAQPKGFSFAEALAPPAAPDPLADSEGHLIDNPDEALKRGAALVQSAWGRLSGTDRPPADTGNAVDTVDTRDTIAPGLRSALAPAANTTYGSILPFARDQDTGDVRLALPSSLRDLATGGLDLLEGPTTGTVTPAATSLLANAAIGGGLNPSLARGTGAAIRDTAELGAPAADLYRPRITATEVQARDGVGIMEAWNRAHAENNAAAIAKIGQATDINEAIAAAGKAAEAPSASTLGDLIAPSADTAAPTIPSGWTVDDRFGPTPGPDAPAEASPYVPITSSQVQRRDGVGAIEAGRRADAENAANAPVPQSVGAAASRDMTQPDLLNEITPAQKATALQKMVNQSAEDRLTPQGRDDNVYFPGVERPEAMRDFTPAADGDVSSALEHKVLYNTDSNYHDQYDALVKKNNNVMVDGLHDMFGDANARDAAMNEAKELMPGPTGLFDGEQSVDAQPIVDRIKKILASPAGKRDAVASQLNRILPKLYDADGNLETLPSQLKGIRDDITDKLYDKTPTVEGNAARTASTQLRSVLGIVDEQIGSGLPGTTYQDYLANLSAALGQVSKLDYLQKFLTGPRKLTDLAGNLQFGKVQKMLEDIQARHADKTGGAKELTFPEINQIEAVRNELAAKDLLDRRAAVRGSPTAQITNATGILGSGPLGAGVKGAGELALHAGLAAKTGGVGNAALLGYRYIVKPGMEAAKARDAAAVLAATKQRLLDTTPRPGP
jgi:hypothetical protein